MKLPLVIFTLFVVSAEAMLQNCKMLRCPVNKTVSSSVAYTIKTIPKYYEPRKAVKGTCMLHGNLIHREACDHPACTFEFSSGINEL